MQSPLKLFHSLKQGDPQSVAFTAVFIFLVSVCWFSWTFLFPPKNKSLPLGGNRFEKQVPIETVSLSKVLKVHRDFLTPEDIPNPFYREPPQERTPKKPKGNPTNTPAKGNPQNNQPQVNSGNGNTPAVTNRPAPPPAEKPKTKPLTLTYRGLLTRPDQSTVALVAVSESGSQKFLSVGDQIPPFTVNQISPEGIQIQKEKGPAIFLPRGETQKFEVSL